MPSVPLHLAVSRESRYLNFSPCVLLLSACMPAVVIATGWAVSALTRLIGERVYALDHTPVAGLS